MSGVLVVMEARGGAWNRMSFETLAAGQELARALGVGARAAVVGSDVAALAGELAAYRLEKVYAVSHALLGEYTADGYAAAVEALVRRDGADVVLFPHTYQARDFAPKVATRFGRVLVSDATGFRAEGGLVFVRQLFQGKLNADVRVSGEGPRFASLQAGAFRAEAAEAGQAAVEEFAVELEAGAIRQRPEAPFRESARAVDLTAAEIIVSVGRGIKEKENIGVVEELARALGAELAASRPICDNGWLPMERQVGSSGGDGGAEAVCGGGDFGSDPASGGVKGSKTIVAINKDANAPIFEVADYGIVGDLFEVAPAIVEEVRRVRG